MSLPRRPVLRVLAGGTEIDGVIGAEVTSVAHYSADRFSIQIALGRALPMWSTQTDTIVEVQIDVDGAAKSIITGRIDSIAADPLRGTLHLEGRDLSASLIQALTHETFANQTSSDIASLLAGRHGLTAAVTATITPVGR